MTAVATDPATDTPIRRPRKASRWQVLRSLALIIVPVFVLATLITFLLGYASGLDPAAGIAGDAASTFTASRSFGTG